MINKLLWPVVVAIVATTLLFILKLFYANSSITISPQPGAGIRSEKLAGKDVRVELQQMHIEDGVFVQPHTVRVNNEPITLLSKQCFELPPNKPVFRINLESFDKNSGIARYFISRVIFSDKNCLRSSE